MTKRDIVVIGASMGGIDALKVLVGALPSDFDASVFITIHVAPQSLGILPEILERAGPLPASNASDWERFEPGHIYVAPPDYHLLLERGGYARTTKGPKENRFRPAVDTLFRSAAAAFGPRVIGVILTGWLDDGTAGLHAVKECGGTAVVQDPRDARAASMPRSAIAHVNVDYTVPLVDIAPLLVRLTREPVPVLEGGDPVPDKIKTEIRIALEDDAVESGILKWGEPSLFACPECHGTLLQMQESGNLRFRCHTGHAYSIESLLAAMGEKTEEALWNALRAVEENVYLMRRIVEHRAAHVEDATTNTLRERVQNMRERASLVRKAVLLRDVREETGSR